MTSEWHISQAVRAVKLGGVIAYPTEAVWGLGCDPWHKSAVERILNIKQRSPNKGLILIASAVEQLEFLLEGLSPEKLKSLRDSWPGAITWLIPHNNKIPYWISGDHDTVAVRVSSHPVITRLVHHTGILVSTSANLSGIPAARTSLKVRHYFPGQLDYILPGYLGGKESPSTIRDLISEKTIRR
ncbi:UNVERIFIED_CONTAM: hypothetical protein GTU68_035418 [Idotea baltica]|nr:hypothetical protein [Idotea baltica]